MVRIALGMALGMALIGMTFSAAAAQFTLSSPDLFAGQMMGKSFVYHGFGCTGGNLSPALNWQNPPAGTQSFAITVHDPDAPTDGGFWHWIVINLPVSMTGLAQGDGTLNSTHLPAGALQIRNDFGIAAWGGPCPPAGDKPHHYHFTVYALKVNRLPIPVNAKPALVADMIQHSALGKAELVVLYGR